MARFRRTKGAIKLHTLLDHAGHIHACPETGKHYLFWTNAFQLCATTVAAIYKQQWQIDKHHRSWFAWSRRLPESFCHNLS